MNTFEFLHGISSRCYLSNSSGYLTIGAQYPGLAISTLRCAGLLALMAVSVGCFGQSAPPATGSSYTPPPSTSVVLEPPPSGDGGEVVLIPVESTQSAQGVKQKAQCYDDSDCAGVFGWIGACEIERCVGGNCYLDTAFDFTPCDDGDVCTLGDICVYGECVPDGGIVDCDDGNPCTADFCEPWGGCSYTALTGGCSDGLGCTEGDFCSGGECISGTDVCVPTGDCCAPHGGLGCVDAGVESCVCSADTYCCEVAWDAQCAQEVLDFGCDDCGFIVIAQDGGCCSPHGGLGCSDPWIEDCVCQGDSYCCAVAWDAQCVDEIALLGCGDCFGPPPPPPVSAVGCFGYCGGQSPDGCYCDDECAANGDCCEDICDSCFTTAQCGPSCLDAQIGPGCGDPACEECVCAADPYCCTTAWDDVCVDEITTFDCWMCD